MQFFPPSKKALETKAGNKLIGVPKYPWADVPVGMSFPVPRENIKFNVLRSLASITGKKLGKKFRAIDHGEGPYEVYCVPMTDAEASQKTSNVVEALKAQKVVNEFGGMEFDENGRVIEKENEE